MTRTQTLLLVFIALVGGFLISQFTRKRPEPDNRLQLIIDSMRVHDHQRDSIVQVLRIQYTQDSFRITSIQRQLSEVPAMINSIKRTYDKKRVYIDTVSDADLGRFFSEWTTKEDQ